MSLGLGIFLIVVGAIRAFAVHATIATVDLQIVGEIMMGADALVVLLGIALILRKRQSTETTRISQDPVSGDQVTRREHREDAIQSRSDNKRKVICPGCSGSWSHQTPSGTPLGTPGARTPANYWATSRP